MRGIGITRAWVFGLGLGFVLSVGYAEPPARPEQASVGEAVSAPAAVPADSRRWSGNGLGISLSYIPLYHPQVGASDRTGAGNFSGFEGAVELPIHGVAGFRLLHASVPSLQAYDPTAFLTTYYPNVSTSLFEIYGGFNLPLNDPDGKLDRFQFFIPLNLGLAFATLDTSDGNFSATAVDASVGLGVHVYTQSFFRAGLTGLYHFGLPLQTITASTQVAQDPTGQSMKFSPTGFELKLGVTFMFPDPPEGYQGDGCPLGDVLPPAESVPSREGSQ